MDFEMERLAWFNKGAEEVDEKAGTGDRGSTRANLMIDINTIEFGEVLGEGSFGEVYVSWSFVWFASLLSLLSFSPFSLSLSSLFLSLISFSLSLSYLFLPPPTPPTPPNHPPHTQPQREMERRPSRDQEDCPHA